ncbi:corticosteroid-binding globulin-like [Nycticebus coucang]|uniref:corticosteroid-binding globulin-like n=1 Tax=Nycticebus coucang TaxID=9470 RepID=UPI00234DC2BD|nr:corticosteroid-binding globulin-like [Nycticebus coucang]XP_053458799.1 corticosteroid-binding globulin-like [Nycticebus coucang]XP_053458800.1 corticosteroid-binding globulin-like [Nycticebus coucang]
MLLALYTCLLWLSTSGLWTIQAENSSADVNMKNHHRGLAPANVDFAFSLYKHLVALTPDKNIFISPVSISMALAMLSLGTCGHTRTQLLQGLGFNLTEMTEVEIHQSFRHLHHLLEESATSLEMTMGNALFFDCSLELLETFLTDIRHFYDSEALATDFQEWDRASRQINEYVQNKTQGKIFNLFSELDSSAILILINYIFFKGTWTQPFDPESTREGNFYVNETTVVKVPMMFQSQAFMYLRDSELPCQLLQLNYVGNGTIFFILPDKGKMDTVINALSRDTIQRWSKDLTISQVDLSIPKVSISGSYDLRRVLADLGLVDLFTSQADFSGIIQKGQLKLSKVIHKAVLQLDEKGVQASASSGVTPYLTSDSINISFNQPFLILIFDHFTWSSLFLGKVVNPT